MEEPRGTKCELKIWQERSKKDGSRETVPVTSLGGVSAIDGQYAIVVRQIFTDKNVPEKTKLTVNSPHILAAFRDVVKSHPTIAADFTEPFDMESPFQMLYHSWEDLSAFKQAVGDDEQRMHLNLLFDLMESEMGADKHALDKALQSRQVSFSSLWTIFQPGSLVITYEKTHPWQLRVVKTAYEENLQLGKFLEVHCTFTDYDGSDVGESKEMMIITQKQNFAQGNPAPIVELPVFPRKYLEKGEEFDEELAERGRQFLSLQGRMSKQYKGPADWMKEPPPSFFDPEMSRYPPVWISYTETGRVVIDRQTYREEYYQAPVTAKTQITREDYMLCPPFVYGYSVARQDWCRFYLPCLQDIDWKPAPFDSLILPGLHLRLVRALVSSHGFPASEQDQSEQKGKGLVILLHGAPGAGKTLTAECAAEATHRILISTSLQQLNKYDQPSSFEFQLRNVLRLATIWKAVVLLDEADVFLESRSETTADSASTARNALVAIFLRHLEYFSGIVFLTTNRIRVFDSAMKSRLHLALEYLPPGAESRSRMWTNCLREIPAGEVDFDVESTADELAKEHFNGREISNLVNTARTLSLFEKVPLGKSHLDAVVGAKNDFERSLKRMRNMSLRSSSHQLPAVQHLGQPIRQGSVLSEEPESLEC